MKRINTVVVLCVVSLNAFSALGTCPDSQYLNDFSVCTECTRCRDLEETVIQTCSSISDTICGSIIDHQHDLKAKSIRDKKLKDDFLKKSTSKKLNSREPIIEIQEKSLDIRQLNETAYSINNILKMNLSNTVKEEKKKFSNNDTSEYGPKFSKHIKKDLSKLRDASQEVDFTVLRYSIKSKSLNEVKTPEQKISSKLKNVEDNIWLQDLRPLIGKDHHIYVDVENDSKHESEGSHVISKVEEESGGMDPKVDIFSQQSINRESFSNKNDRDDSSNDEEYDDSTDKKNSLINNDLEDDDEDEDEDDDEEEDEDDENKDEINSKDKNEYPAFGTDRNFSLLPQDYDGQDDEIEESFQKNKVYLTDNDANIEPYTDSSNWQLLILVSAASACLLFFIVVNAYLCIYLKKWKHMKEDCEGDGRSGTNSLFNGPHV